MSASISAVPAGPAWLIQHGFPFADEGWGPKSKESWAFPKNRVLFLGVPCCANGAGVVEFKQE
jgi:hypothetical protein